MPAPDAARRHYLAQKALAAVVVNQMRSLWARVDLADLDASWAAQRVEMFDTLAAGQTIAAGQADPYVNRVLAEQHIDPAATGTIDPNGFAGTASDGRELETLLYEPVITTKVALAQRRGVAESLASGEAAFVRIAATQVQDAGRTAVGVAIAARPAVMSYTRMLNPPSCSRCAVLAGKVYRWNDGFKRHPHCDCTHIPSSESVAGDLTTDPGVYFRSLSTADQDRYFTKAGAEVIRNGGDMNQVVNARRGMYEANGRTFTTTGTTVRGFAGSRLRAGGSLVRKLPGARYRSTAKPRLMPETIIEVSNGDRAETIRQLRRNGYLI